MHKLKSFLLLSPLLVGSSSSASVFATREEYVAHLNALPGMTWRAGVAERFKNTPIGSSASLLGVKPHSRDELLALVANGTVASYGYNNGYDGYNGLPPQYAGLPDPPDAFDSETNWPQCADTIGDIRDQSDCGTWSRLPCDS
jgi:hypothetical protein